MTADFTTTDKAREDHFTYGTERMYESFFGFVKRPFLAVSTLDRYFPATSIEQTFQTTARAIQRGEGPVAIFGGAGLGKTMCCLRIAENFRRNFEVVMLASSQLITRRALLQSLLFELRMPYLDMSEGELRLTLMNRLQPSTENPTDGLVLIIDEAQTLSMKLLEEIRLLTNVVRNGVPRVRLVLCGTMRLEECLAHPHMDSLNQRLAARCYLTPLSIQETGHYVTHKIELSGVNSASIVTKDALDAIYRGSDGIPRLIDQLADQALMLACNDRERPVSAAMVGRAWCMLQQLPNPWSEPESISKEPVTEAIVSQSAPTIATPTLAKPRSVESTNRNVVPVTTPTLPTTSTPAAAPFKSVDTATKQPAIEFGQLDDDFDSDLNTFNVPVTNAPSLFQSTLPPFETQAKPAPMQASNTLPSIADGRDFDEDFTAASNPAAPNSSEVNSTTPRKKNLLDVFAGDFDEEFSIPVQSSGSYQAYSGAAYGNLNHDLTHFSTQPTGANLNRRVEIEEANEFLSNPFAPNQNMLSRAFQLDKAADDAHDEETTAFTSALESAYSEPVSNISAEQAANLERQIEDEMRELVSGLNLNAMTFDPSTSIDTITNQISFQEDTLQHETNFQASPMRSPRGEEQRLAHQSHSDVIAFSNLHDRSELGGRHEMSSFNSDEQRAAMSDDRDLLVIEDELESVRRGVQQATTTTRAVLHPYAKLFTKLRNS
jgi:type II secretory pathway predicted ATPase ExeA